MIFSFAALDMASLWHAMLLGGVVELGDPTFFVAVLLTAWCPFQGLRSMRGATCQRLCIFLGAAGAIALRIVFVMMRIKLGIIDIVTGFSSVGIFLIMAFRALVEFWSNKEDVLEYEDAEAAQLAKKGSYGATTFMGQDRMRKSLLPLSFLTALIVIYAALPDGRWDQFLLKGEPPSLSFALGAGLGFGFSPLHAFMVTRGGGSSQFEAYMVLLESWRTALDSGARVDPSIIGGQPKPREEGAGILPSSG